MLIYIVSGLLLIVKIFDDQSRSLMIDYNENKNFVAGCINGYLSCVDYDEATNDSDYNGYKSVIESTSREQTLVRFNIDVFTN